MFKKRLLKTISVLIGIFISTKFFLFLNDISKKYGLANDIYELFKLIGFGLSVMIILAIFINWLFIEPFIDYRNNRNNNL